MRQGREGLVRVQAPGELRKTRAEVANCVFLRIPILPV
jgi:hypothetical protein